MAALSIEAQFDDLPGAGTWDYETQQLEAAEAEAAGAWQRLESDGRYTPDYLAAQKAELQAKVRGAAERARAEAEAGAAQYTAFLGRLAGWQVIDVGKVQVSELYLAKADCEALDAGGIGAELQHAMGAGELTRLAALVRFGRQRIEGSHDYEAQKALQAAEKALAHPQAEAYIKQVKAGMARAADLRLRADMHLLNVGALLPQALQPR